MAGTHATERRPLRTVSISLLTADSVAICFGSGQTQGFFFLQTVFSDTLTSHRISAEHIPRSEPPSARSAPLPRDYLHHRRHDVRCPRDVPYWKRMSLEMRHARPTKSGKNFAETPSAEAVGRFPGRGQSSQTKKNLLHAQTNRRPRIPGGIRETDFTGMILAFIWPRDARRKTSRSRDKRLEPVLIPAQRRFQRSATNEKVHWKTTATPPETENEIL